MLDRFSALNRETACNWDAFATHRAKVTALIQAACGAGAGRIAILGAGNCNDIDLHALARIAESVELLDVDSAAVREGLARQGLERSDRIHVHAGVDVTGAIERLEPWVKRSPSEEEITAYEAQVSLVPALPHAGQCDVVVSSCLLSALISTIVQTLGQDHPRTLDLVTRLRDQHLRVLATEATPGGRALLVSDLVSSDTCPALLEAKDDALAALMTDVLAARNFFTGMNPFVVVHRLQALGSHGVHDVSLVGPWRWRISDARAYLVYALAFSIRASRAPQISEA